MLSPAVPLSLAANKAKVQPEEEEESGRSQEAENGREEVRDQEGEKESVGGEKAEPVEIVDGGDKMEDHNLRSEESTGEGGQSAGTEEVGVASTVGIDNKSLKASEQVRSEGEGLSPDKVRLDGKEEL